MHVAEVLRQQGANLWTGEIIDANLHDPFAFLRIAIVLNHSGTDLGSSSALA